MPPLLLAVLSGGILPVLWGYVVGPPKDGHTLTPRISWEYVTIHSKRGFEGVIRLGVLRWGDDLALSSVPNAITRAPIGGDRSVRIRDDNVGTEAEETRPRSK